MATRKKLGNIPGAAEWQSLETIGDLKRFLRWVILSMRDGRLCRADAAVFSHIANTMARVMEGADLEQRVESLENAANGVQYDPRKTHPTNGIEVASEPEVG